MALQNAHLALQAGLGFLIGRLFMVITTTRRKSGAPRHTAVEFQEFEGKVTALSGWGTKTDWYFNLQANPIATVQTWHKAGLCGAAHLLLPRLPPGKTS